MTKNRIWRVAMCRAWQKIRMYSQFEEFRIATQTSDGSGLATFGDLSLDLSGSKKLTASSGAVTSGESNAFTINAATANQLAFAQLRSTNGDGLCERAAPVERVLQDSGREG